MENNKGQTIFLSVIGIATLLVAIIGATFAYFTTTMTGTAGTVSATTATVGSITYTAGSINETNKIYPGWSQEATVTINRVGASEIALPYKCTLTMTSLPSGMKVVVTNPTAGVTNKVSTATALSTTAVELVTGSFAASADTSAQQSFKYTVSFPETGTNQNGTGTKGEGTQNLGKAITGSVTCVFTGTGSHYTWDSTNHTGKITQ